VRQIGEINNEADAKRFSEYLIASGITHDLQDEDTGSWAIWVHEEDLLAKAEVELNEFLKNPTSSRYPEAIKKGATDKPEEEPPKPDPSEASPVTPVDLMKPPAQLEATPSPVEEPPKAAPPILPQEEAVPPMPLKVALAIKLIYIQIMISIVYTLFLPSRGGDAYRAGNPDLGPDAAGLHMVASVIGGLVCWFLAYNIGKGRNWARIIFAVLAIIGILFAVLTFVVIFLMGFNGQVIEVMLAIGNQILSLVTVVFLFQKSSSDWFKEMAT